MDYQIFNRFEKEIEAASDLLYRRNGISPDSRNFEIFVWPVVSSSTAGPAGGIGGQAISKFSIIGIKNGYRGDGVLIYSGKSLYVEKFEPLMKWQK